MLTINKKMELPADFVEMNESETALTGGVTEAGKTVAYVGAGIAGACVVAANVTPFVVNDQELVHGIQGTLSFVCALAGSVAIVAASIGAFLDKTD